MNSRLDPLDLWPWVRWTYGLGPVGPIPLGPLDPCLGSVGPIRYSFSLILLLVLTYVLTNIRIWVACLPFMPVDDYRMAGGKSWLLTTIPIVRIGFESRSCRIPD